MAVRERPSALHHARFIQPGLPAFWLYVGLLLVTGVVAIYEQTLFRSMAPSGFALSWVLLALYALPVFVLIWVLDLYEREPLSLMVAAFVWGAIVATTLAGLANGGWGLVVARIGGPEFAARWSAALTAPLVEETLKGLGVVMIYLIAREEFDDVMDGFIYGAVCGLGFAVVEDVFYFVGVFGGDIAGVVQGFFLRVVASGFYGHVLYTGLVGMGIGVVVSRRLNASIERRLAICAALLVAALFGHFLWNSPLLSLYPPEPWTLGSWPQIMLATTVKGLPLLLFGVLAVRLARARERRWIREALAGEVERGVVSARDLEVLASPRRSREERRAMRRRAGRTAASLLHRLQREQVNLAMVASRVPDDDDPALRHQRRVCLSLRDALRAMPGAAPADAGPPGRLRA